MNDYITPEERELIRRLEEAEAAPGMASSVLGGVGTVAGGIIGGLLASPSGIGIPAGIAAGSTLGGAAGSALGGLGGMAYSGIEGEKLRKQLEEIQARRLEQMQAQQQKEVEKAARMEAFQRLLGRYSSF